MTASQTAAAPTRARTRTNVVSLFASLAIPALSAARARFRDVIDAGQLGPGDHVATSRWSGGRI